MRDMIMHASWATTAGERVKVRARRHDGHSRKTTKSFWSEKHRVSRRTDSQEEDTDSEIEADYQGDGNAVNGATNPNAQKAASSSIPTATGAQQTSPTSTTALSDSDSVAHDIEQSNEHLSEKTQKLLIALGAIGFAIIVLLLLYAVYYSRKRSISFQSALATPFRRMRDKGRRQRPQSLEPQSEWPGWEYGPRKDSTTPASSRLSYIKPPEAVPIRESVGSEISIVKPKRSERPEFGLPQRPDSLKKTGSFLDDCSVDDSKSIENERGRHVKTRRTISSSDDECGRPEPPPKSPAALRSPGNRQSQAPYFRQFLNGPRFSAPKVSRFSWTNSQATPSPHEPGSHFSIATSRSSLARFRTVDSWVAQQAGRLEISQSRHQNRNAPGVENPVPDVPSRYRPRNSTMTLKSEATVFRQHPGERVNFDRVSVVPSEILNSKVSSHAL